MMSPDNEGKRRASLHISFVDPYPEPGDWRLGPDLTTAGETKLSLVSSDEVEKEFIG